MEDYSQYSGESFYQRPPKINLENIGFDGNTGKFVKKERVNEEVTKTDIGDTFECVVLRVRRRLNAFNEGYSTSEHNSPTDNVVLFAKGKMIDQGVAKDLREKYPTLRTQQLLYVYCKDGNVKKMIIQGASLGSENKPKDSVPFYEYLGDFGKEHLWQYWTHMTPMPEKNKAGKKYFAISFSKGDKVPDEEFAEKMGPEMKKLHVLLSSLDAYYLKPKEEKKKAEEPKTLAEIGDEASTEPVINLDEEPEQQEPVEEIPF